MESIDITPTKVRGMGNVMKNNDDRTRIGIRNSVVEDDESLVEYDGAAWPVFNMTCHPRVNEANLSFTFANNKTVYTVIDTIHMNISATNYNNNPIPNLSVQVLVDGSVLTTVTTDENGLAVYEFTRSVGTYSLSLASASSSRWDAATSTAKTIKVEKIPSDLIFDNANWNSSVVNNTETVITSSSSTLKYMTTEFTSSNIWEDMVLHGELDDDSGELILGLNTDGTGDYIMIRYRVACHGVAILKIVGGIETLVYCAGNLETFDSLFEDGIQISRSGNNWVVESQSINISGLKNTIAVKGNIHLTKEGFSFSN